MEELEGSSLGKHGFVIKVIYKRVLKIYVE